MMMIASTGQHQGVLDKRCTFPVPRIPSRSLKYSSHPSYSPSNGDGSIIVLVVGNGIWSSLRISMSEESEDVVDGDWVKRWAMNVKIALQMRRFGQISAICERVYITKRDWQSLLSDLRGFLRINRLLLIDIFSSWEFLKVHEYRLSPTLAVSIIFAQYFSSLIVSH